MHCPRCGQQQISEEIKFCSRCGFPLGLISEVISHGGSLPQLAELREKRTVFTRRNGVIFSFFWFMFFLLIMAPIWGILDVDELAGASAILGIFGGIMLMTASLIFLKPTPKNYNLQTQELPAAHPQTLYGGKQTALPPQQSIPVDVYAPPQQGNWRDTNDLTPPSVTDNTTKLLNKEE